MPFGGRGFQLQHKALFLAACLVALPSTANAASVYLECSLPDGKGGMAAWSLNVNEEQSMVTVAHPLATRNVPASFLPDKITWDKGDFTLDRTTLVLVRRPTFQGMPLGKPDSGQCKVSERKRAI